MSKLQVEGYRSIVRDTNSGAIISTDKRAYMIHVQRIKEARQSGVDLRNDNDEYDTIGGLVFSLTNRIPIRGELIKDSDGNEFSIIDADPRRIKRLRIYLAPKVNITASDQ